MTIRTKRKYTCNPTRKQRKAAENVIVKLSLTCTRADARRMAPFEKISAASLLLDLNSYTANKRYNWFRASGVQCFLSSKHETDTHFKSDTRLSLLLETSTVNRFTNGRFSALFQNSK